MARPDAVQCLSPHRGGQTMTLKLDIKDLGVTYVRNDGQATEAVRGFELEVADKPGVGEVIVLLGPSGCGKSTVLKAVAGLLRPTKGSVKAAGQLIESVGADRG